MEIKHEFTKKINSNKTLNLNEKSILNEILSYTQSGKLFYATDKALAEEWGLSVPTIQRIFLVLKHFGLVRSDVQRKPHLQDGMSWYNKRYITVNRDALKKFLETEGVLEKPKKNNTGKITPQPEKKITIETNQPIIFDCPDNGGDTITDEMFFENISTPSYATDGPKSNELEHFLRDEPKRLDEMVSLYTFLPSLGLAVPDVMIFIEDKDTSTMAIKDVIAQINKYLSQHDNRNYAGPTLPENIHERINNLLQIVA